MVHLAAWNGKRKPQPKGFEAARDDPLDQTDGVSQLLPCRPLTWNPDSLFFGGEGSGLDHCRFPGSSGSMLVGRRAGVASDVEAGSHNKDTWLPL